MKSKKWKVNKNNKLIKNKLILSNLINLKGNLNF